MLQEMLDVERQRIESTNRKTEVARYQAENAEASDKRAFEYAMARLQKEEKEGKSRHDLAKTVILAMGGAVLLVIFGLLGFTFYGTEMQRDVAATLLKILFTGLAGYGVISSVSSVLRKLLK